MGKKGRREKPEAAQAQEGLTAEDKKFAWNLEILARGIIIGGAIGAIAGWFFLDPGRAFGLGLLSGCLAAVTMKNIRERRGK